MPVAEKNVKKSASERKNGIPWTPFVTHVICFTILYAHDNGIYISLVKICSY